MNQSTSFHVCTISALFRMELISRVSYDIECLLTCQAVDFVIKTTFLPGKLPGQLTTHSSSLNLLSLTHMIATANWLHKLLYFIHRMFYVFEPLNNQRHTKQHFV